MENTSNEKTVSAENTELKDKLHLAEARIAALESENNNLLKELAVLRSANPGTEAAGFIEASGVLWKRNTSGGYESIPYCPTCKSTLSDYSGSLLCLACNWQAPIKSFEAPKVFHDLFGGK